MIPLFSQEIKIAYHMHTCATFDGIHNLNL